MRRPASLLALVLAATAVAYAPCLRGPFLLDDYITLADPLIARPWAHGLGAWLSSPRPVATFTFAANYLLGGADPLGWHLGNVAIHLGAVALAFAFARASLARAGLAHPDGAALAAAALFALHPLQAESVAYVTKRAEALASALFLGALLLLLARDRAGTAGRRAALLGGALALQALALMTKPIAATLPAAWLLHAAILPPPGEESDSPWRRVRRRALAAAPAFALSAVSAVRGLSAAEGSVHAGFSVPGLPPGDSLATQLRVIPTYLRLLAWPAGQSGDWTFPASRSFAEPAVLLGAAFLLAAVVLAVLAAAWAGSAPGEGRAVARASAFGGLFFLLALSPSSVVPLLDPLAEHRVYLASLGLFLAAAAAGAVALRGLAPRQATAAGAALLLLVAGGGGVLTARRAAVWASQLAFWTEAAERSPGKARVQLNLAHALYNVGLVEPALAAMKRAHEASGDGTVARETVLANVVTVLSALGRVDDARAELERDLARFPGDATALALVAQVEAAARRDEAAERAALAALAAKPRNTAVPSHVIALKALGSVRMRRGDLRGALEAFRAASATNVVDPEVYLSLGLAEELDGNGGGACRALARAASQPGNQFAAGAARQHLARLRCR